MRSNTSRSETPAAISSGRHRVTQVTAMSSGIAPSNRAIASCLKKGAIMNTGSVADDSNASSASHRRNGSEFIGGPERFDHLLTVLTHVLQFIAAHVRHLLTF